jgi:hypothetical protein
MEGVWIIWGSQPEPGTRPTRYEFETHAELDAFLDGVEAASGWMEYRVQDDDKPWPDPNQTEEDEGV